ncbi:hypothetical protein ACLBOM_12645 [Escherichia coli]
MIPQPQHRTGGHLCCEIAVGSFGAGETSFITNPEEERLLGTAAFRQKIATAIAEGVISYFHSFDNQKAHQKAISYETRRTQG